MSKKTARQHQIAAKKKYNKARQKLNTTKNKYSDVLAKENMRFEEEQQFFKHEINSSYGLDAEELARRIRKKWEYYARTEHELKAEEIRKKIQFLNRVADDLEALARGFGPLGRALASLQDKVNVGFSGIMYEAITLKRRYLDYLEKFNILVEQFPMYQQILNEVSGMLPLKFFFVYNKLSSQFKIENLGETFASDTKRIGEGDDDVEVVSILEGNIHQLYMEITDPDLTEVQLADIEALEKEHS